jgi:hypothetical protein
MSLSYKHVPGWNPEDEKFDVFDNSKWDPELVAVFFDEARAARYVREENEKVKNERR